MVTDEVLSTGTVKNIAALIAGANFPDDAFFLAEQVPLSLVEDRTARANLLRFACVRDLQLDTEKDKIDPALYTTGRIFAPDFELRWYQDTAAGQIRVVYLGAKRELPGLEFDPDSQDKLKKKLDALTRKEKPKHYYLFGEPLSASRLTELGLEKEQSDLANGEGYYAELRIPRLLRYPIVTEKRVQLTVCEYIEEVTGRVELFRFWSLTEVGETHESV